MSEPQEYVIYNKKTKQLSSNVSLKDIKAYDGEVKSIFFSTEEENIEIGDDLGWGGEVGAEKIQENLIFHKYVGKTDDTKEENKIYTDCSKVEMTIIDEDGRHAHIGTFNYNESVLCYEFREPFDNGGMSGDNIWRLDRLLLLLSGSESYWKHI